jgi:hypothetical protein
MFMCQLKDYLKLRVKYDVVHYSGGNQIGAI